MSINLIMYEWFCSSLITSFVSPNEVLSSLLVSVDNRNFEVKLLKVSIPLENDQVEGQEQIQTISGFSSYSIHLTIHHTTTLLIAIKPLTVSFLLLYRKCTCSSDLNFIDCTFYILLFFYFGCEILYDWSLLLIIL